MPSPDWPDVPPPDNSALSPENLVYEVIADEIIWGRYVLRCPECSSTTGWSLRVQTPPWTAGERAWAVCPLGHVVRHPLIYPEMVHALVDWSAADPAQRPALGDRLKSLNWRPHLERVLDSHDADQYQVPYVEYHAWDEDGFIAPMPDWWQRVWPGLYKPADDSTG